MAPRRPVFREGAWRDLEPTQKGLVLGVLAGALVALVTWRLSWLALGVLLGAGIGYLVERRRRTGRRTGRHGRDGSPMGRSRHPHHRPEESPADRAERLGWAATYHATRMLEGRTDRAGAVGQVRDTVPGFDPGRYEAEVDAALARIQEYRVGVRARRAERVAQARELDVLNAVFALHYFNRRYSRHPGQYGLGPIDLAEALGDLAPRGQLAEAVARCDALIEEGIRTGTGHGDVHADMAHLRREHPGFNDRALGDALDWGWYYGR
ncbi:hypothetical protein [Citricoccus sp. SGAir0253]|uniref:hypothetical protein n=1 Tax=Citricoccus sp. SGAir0253 TaxID=2567881 RepID=UPI00143D41EB|nr:hypothetical protein [Citricoccus sp. SGAir0253]